VPNPLCAIVCPLASHWPSGDLDSADQIVSEPLLQPPTAMHIPINTSAIALQRVRILPAQGLLIKLISLFSLECWLEMAGSSVVLRVIAVGNIRNVG
jgi:hypothetical protein